MAKRKTGRAAEREAAARTRKAQEGTKRSSSAVGSRRKTAQKDSTTSRAANKLGSALDKAGKSATEKAKGGKKTLTGQLRDSATKARAKSNKKDEVLNGPQRSVRSKSPKKEETKQREEKTKSSPRTNQYREKPGSIRDAESRNAGRSRYEPGAAMDSQLIRSYRGQNSAAELGGNNYGMTGSRNAITNDLDNYITWMAGQTGDQYVQGGGMAGNATANKDQYRQMLMQQQAMQRAAAQRAMMMQQQQQQGMGGYAPQQYIQGGSYSNTGGGYAPPPLQQAAPGGRPPAAPQQPPHGRQAPPQFVGPPVPPQQPTGQVPPIPNFDPLQGMRGVVEGIQSMPGVNPNLPGAAQRAGYQMPAGYSGAWGTPMPQAQQGPSKLGVGINDYVQNRNPLLRTLRHGLGGGPAPQHRQR